MQLMPKYAENIIVLVQYKSSFRWFVTDKELWFLDLRKLITSYLEKGLKINNPDDFSDRFDIAIVNEDNADVFLHNIRDFEVTNDELKKILAEGRFNHISDMLPSLYVDFDAKKLTSYYPEPASYEFYIPNNWEGKYDKLLGDVPKEYRYWVIQGKNLFSPRVS
ncbi:hypothetical protein SAMN04487897_11589 [Paenibacillus sp. yr247]|uniref:hypothetical protein n=1 Tax=Paenibacillus sp. yr247 TaxID=1761880 RepID=UPI000881455C|nr:hypothetical protein [Paenibacillus sp. yr247]SDO50256.1 hypothetical protein SAMN04487897_11589 [Paenibacillus sp. yr247]